MKTRIHTILPLAALAGLAIATGSAGAATTLTGQLGNNSTVPADHGSNAVGTPNVTLNWDANWDGYTGWPNDGGDGVYQHDRGLGDPHTIDFTPDANWAVALQSLDTNVWSGGGDTDMDWSVTGSSSGLLGNGTMSTSNATAVTHAIGVTGVAGETLTLSLTQTSGATSYFAIDNLTFDQATIPEPSSMALLGLGGLALILRRRK